MLVMNLKDWFDCSLQLNSELSFSSEQKTDITNLQSEKIGIHEVEILTNLNIHDIKLKLFQTD
jgi:hypothetical protein